MGLRMNPTLGVVEEETTGMQMPVRPQMRPPQPAPQPVAAPKAMLDKAKGWMTPQRADAFSALGLGLSQLSAGQPVNLAPARAQMLKRQQRSEQQRMLEQSGLMEKFSPDQRAILASMEPSAAQRIIASALFKEPPAKKAPIEINGQLVDPDTMQVVGDYRTPETPSAPTVKKATLQDGSEAMLEWRPDPKDAVNGGSWVPLDAPLGGADVKPKGKLTEKQSQLTLFSRMQEETSPILSKIEEQYNPANIPDAAARNTPLAGNFFQTEEGQIYSASSAAWAEGALRIATGAAATQPEIERTQRTYFAVPGDTPATIQFKSQMREMYSRAIDAALGNAVEGGLVLPDAFAKDLETGGGDTNDALTDDELQYLELGS